MSDVKSHERNTKSFKKGDKLRRIKISLPHMETGSIHVVDRINVFGNIYFVGNSVYTYSPENFELVEETIAEYILYSKFRNPHASTAIGDFHSPLIHGVFESIEAARKFAVEGADGKAAMKNRKHFFIAKLCDLFEVGDVEEEVIVRKKVRRIIND